ncbi:dienelactone hydrolase family protein [Paraburkholderia phenazinium]|uniref:dienelactone hydrolase family protein n=1 Tax=Paraburkholderia phenazinium TaxID=60549 RepID=UPI00158CA685|nr:CocE/NonD family hydrolase [Paraburkholderia phenazinium]
MRDKPAQTVRLRCAQWLRGTSRRLRAHALLLSLAMAGAPLSALAQTTAVALQPASGTSAAAVSLLPGLVREHIGLPISLPDGAKPTLEALVVRPQRPGRWPLIVMTPGTPRSSGAGVTDRAPELLLNAAVTFAQHGYAAVVVLRRGFGHSDGPYAESSGSCHNEDYLGPGKASADDVLGALDALRAQPWVDGERVLLLGKSTGGFAVLAAAARNPQGVLGVLDFAGGRGSSRPDYVCRADQLIAAVGEYGTTAKIPSQWVWSENDHYFSPDLARQMLSAYTAHGAQAQLAVLPAFQEDGHELLYEAPADAWWPAVEPFLKSLSLPTQVVVELPALTALPQPQGLNRGCQDSFNDYGAWRNEGKAFVTAEGGHCNLDLMERTAQEAAQHALEHCQSKWSGCKVYAEGQQVVQ